MFYYDHNIGDFAIETRGLTYELIGIYISLLDRFASTQKPITGEWLEVAYQGETKSKAIALLNAFFVKREEGYVHLRLEQQIAAFEALSKTRSEAGKKGGRRKKSVPSPATEQDAEEAKSNCLAIESITNKPVTNKPVTNKPTTSNQEKREKKPLVFPADLPADVRDEWVAYKKKMCRSCTQRMVDDIVEQARLAGMSLADAMVYQMKKGWKGFEAEWVRNSSSTGPSKAFNPDPDYFDEEPF